jgi:hypothetical protein
MTLARLPIGLVAALAALAAAAPSPARADTVRSAPSLLAHWPLDEKAGTTLLDAVAARVGTLVGGAVLGAQTARSDDAGAGIMLLGSSAVALDGAPAFPANVTLEAWVNPLAGVIGTRYILSRGTATSGLHLRVDSFNRLVLAVGNANGSTLLTGPAIAAGTWHHVAATVAGLDTVLYLDGKPVANRTLTAPPAATASTLYLGRYSGSATGYWRGGLDEVSLYDGALDAAAVAASFASVADVTPPAVRVSAAPPARSGRPDAALSFSATKGGSTFICRLDTRPAAPCGASTSYSGLAEGDHAVAVLATDRYGIAGATPATVSWNVDLTSPETLLLAERPTHGVPGEAGFVSESAAGFECQVDGAAWSACTSPLDAPAGSKVAVRARDGAGNADPTPATAVVAPQTGAAPFEGASASFVVAGQHSSSDLQCRLNGGGWATCPDSMTFTNLPYGPNALSVRDSGLPGVAGAASVTWTAPLPAPSLINARFPLLVTFASRRAQRRTKPARAPRLLYRSNTDGTGAVVLRRAGRVVGQWSAPFHRGSNTLVFPIDRLRRLAAGRHVLTLQPRNATGAGAALTRRFDVVRLRGR